MKAPPATPHFVFTPPNSTPPRSDMAIAILKPETQGSLYVEQVALNPGTPNATTSTRPRMYVDQMLVATQTDLEKIIIAKGFPTAGEYPTIDEMTYSEKMRSTLILEPVFQVDLQVTRQSAFGGGQTATVSGTVALEFVEPMTHEKIWLKRLQLEPFTKVVATAQPTLAELLNTQPNRQKTITLQDNSVVDLLNTFYAASMQKIWDQLDTNEIAPLKQQVAEVRKSSGYSRPTR